MFQSWRKPFNPVLGETWQGCLSDGSKVFLEQISHHPPISAFQLDGPSVLPANPSSLRAINSLQSMQQMAVAPIMTSLSCVDGMYQFSGMSQPEVSFELKANSIKTLAKGERRIIFKNGVEIEIDYPSYCMRGPYLRLLLCLLG